MYFLILFSVFPLILSSSIYERWKRACSTDRLDVLHPAFEVFCAPGVYPHTTVSFLNNRMGFFSSSQVSPLYNTKAYVSPQGVVTDIPAAYCSNYSTNSFVQIFDFKHSCNYVTYSNSSCNVSVCTAFTYTEIVVGFYKLCLVIPRVRQVRYLVRAAANHFCDVETNRVLTLPFPHYDIYHSNKFSSMISVKSHNDTLIELDLGPLLNFHTYYDNLNFIHVSLINVKCKGDYSGVYGDFNVFPENHNCIFAYNFRTGSHCVASRDRSFCPTVDRLQLEIPDPLHSFVTFPFYKTAVKPAFLRLDPENLEFFTSFMSRIFKQTAFSTSSSLNATLLRDALLGLGLNFSSLSFKNLFEHFPAKLNVSLLHFLSHGRQLNSDFIKKLPKMFNISIDPSFSFQFPDTINFEFDENKTVKIADEILHHFFHFMTGDSQQFKPSRSRRSITSWIVGALADALSTLFRPFFSAFIEVFGDILTIILDFLLDFEPLFEKIVNILEKDFEKLLHFVFLLLKFFLKLFFKLLLFVDMEFLMFEYFIIFVISYFFTRDVLLSVIIVLPFLLFIGFSRPYSSLLVDLHSYSAVTQQIIFEIKAFLNGSKQVSTNSSHFIVTFLNYSYSAPHINITNAIYNWNKTLVDGGYLNFSVPTHLEL